MPAFLFLLVKLNLAMGMAIILVGLLRRPLRLLFGAPIAYAIWLLVPIAGIACLLPPRVVASTPVTWLHLPAAPASVTGPIAHAASRVTEQLTGQSTLTAIAVSPSASTTGMPDTVLLLFSAWVLGTLLMTLYLTRLQLRFSAAVRRGEAGPAVLGLLRPRIVTPDSFQEHFTPQEQAAILAHERVHLARQDARINALTALLRCLCWFNPLVHLGARWLRIDQELACDATTVAGAISRRVYAEALLKSQLGITSLPLGCNWPGSQHPLVERIALLKRRPPGTARRLAGVGLVMVAASCAGLAAWAAQPPVAAKAMAAAKPSAAPAALPAPSAGPRTESVAAPSQTDRLAVAANPASSGKDASEKVRASSTALPAPARVREPNIGSVEARMQIALAALPQIAPTSESSAPPSVGGTNAVVMANTPSGAPDSDTIVCRAPQRIAGSNQFGPEACGHNYEWWKLAMNGKDLAPDGRTLIDKPTVDNPKGDGDPDAVTCRTPKFVFLGPLVTVCLTNRNWADIIKNHQIVAADGRVETRPRRAFLSDSGGSNPPGFGGNGSGFFTDSGSTYIPGGTAP